MTGLSEGNSTVLLDNHGEFVPPPPPSSMTGLSGENSAVLPAQDQGNQDPEPPTPLVPANGDTSVSITPLLAVEPYPGGLVFYHFCVWQGGSKLAEKLTPLPFWFIYEGRTYFTAGNYYQWSCRVWSAGRWSGWFNPEWTYAITWPSAAPTPLTPLNESRVATLTPVLSVVPTMIGNRYRFRIEEQGGPFVMEHDTRFPFWRVPGGAGYLQWEHIYNWTCRADLSNGWSNWFSPHWRFVTSNPADGAQIQGATRNSTFTCRARPNLFTGQTLITYNLPRAAAVTLSFYTVQGREVRTAVLNNQLAGIHEFTWNGCDQDNRQLPAGVYLYCLQAGDNEKSERITKTR